MIFPELHLALARAKADDLRRAADAHRLARQPPPPVAADRSVTLRFASRAGQEPLARLAEPDGSTPPAQPVWLAEVDKIPRIKRSRRLRSWARRRAVASPKNAS
jgi:hypothetical protein